MLVIDTNVASELMRSVPTPSVAAWIAERDAAEIYLTAVSEAELRFGVAILPAGKPDRRQAGRPIGEADCRIAAISRLRSAVLVTRNVRDFQGTGVEVVDPWATG